ncbi:MAG: hypothetical protein OXK74_15820, partial [Gemmatimonadota bacterium]|nr:hypothetical protein [Gemmatimonadota bacterium]
PRWPTRMTCYPPEKGKNPQAMSNPIQATTADLAGMLNAVRKVLYIVIEALPPEQEEQVRERVAGVIREMGKAAHGFPEAKAELATLNTYLSRIEE